jgi:type I restriction enzyme, S subunit
VEVKKGYKQTEVGVIPEEWEVSTFDQVFDITAGGDFDPEKSKSYLDEFHCYPIYSNALTNGGLFGYSSYANHCPGSITITARGTLGVANFRDHAYTAIGRVLVLHPKSDIEGRFFAEVINSRVKFAIESTGVPQLTAPQISTYKLPVPPLPEQRAIVATLSAVDALIEALDQLIYKECDLKQAAMQQLLTGKTRLPGFCAEWEVKTIDKLASVSKGTQLHSIEANLNGKFTHLNGGITPSSYTDRSNTPANTIAISEGGNSCGYVQFMTEPYWCGGHCYSIISTSIDNRFLYHALKMQQSAIMALRVGSGLPNVQKTAILSFKLNCPVSDAEQTAIAAVLSDMDAEIAALERRRDKTRALKQGMMQELLTGRIRLVTGANGK